MSNAERQKRYRDNKRNAQGVTDEIERVTVEPPPQDAPQSTNGGGVVAERTRKVAIPGDADRAGSDWHTPKGMAILASLDAQLRQRA